MASLGANYIIPAQTTSFAVSSEEVNVEIDIGPKTKKTMKINIPLMISGMDHGVSLSELARLSLAGAAKNTTTAINSGEGGVLPEELNTVKTEEKSLTASIEDMKTTLREMEKCSLKELLERDLVSYDESTARMAGTPFSFKLWTDTDWEKQL